MNRKPAVAASAFLAAAVIISGAALFTHVKPLPAEAAVSASEALPAKLTHARGNRSAAAFAAVIEPVDAGSGGRRGATDSFPEPFQGPLPATSVARR